MSMYIGYAKHAGNFLVYTTVPLNKITIIPECIRQCIEFNIPSLIYSRQSTYPVGAHQFVCRYDNTKVIPTNMCTGYECPLSRKHMHDHNMATTMI